MTSTVLTPPPPVERTTTSTPPRLRPVRYEAAPGGSRPGSPRPDPRALRHPPPGSLRTPPPPNTAPPPNAAPSPNAPAPPNAAAGPIDPEHAERIEAHEAATRLLRTALEVFDGRRPAAHIVDQTAPAVLRYWQVASRHRRPRSPTRFTRMRLCLPRTGVAEVAATCDIDGRARALAARFERVRGNWRCTAVRLG